MCKGMMVSGLKLSRGKSQIPEHRVLMSRSWTFHWTNTTTPSHIDTGKNASRKRACIHVQCVNMVIHNWSSQRYMADGIRDETCNKRASKPSAEMRYNRSLSSNLLDHHRPGPLWQMVRSRGRQMGSRIRPPRPRRRQEAATR